MRTHFRMLVCAAAVAAAEARAGEQSAGLQYQPSPLLSGDLRGEEPGTFWERFAFAFDHRSPGVFEDQFHPFNLGNWNAQWTAWNLNRLTDYNSGVARHAFYDTFRLSAWDAVLESNLPALEWLRARQGFLAGFLWNSLDNVEEQSVSPLNPSFRSIERSWWNQLSEGDRFRYGVRPFRTDPYAYLGWTMKSGDSVWLLGNARYYFRNFGDHCFELALSTPVVRGFSIDLGTSYQFGAHQAEKKAVLKLLKTFKSGAILHAALEARQEPMLFAGITAPW